MPERNATVDGPLVDGARSVEAAASRIREKVVAGTEHGLESSRAYITENPLQSVLVAVGVGAVLGYIVGRRSG